MTLEVRQQCDICGLIRTFQVTDLRRFTDIQQAAQRDNWVVLDRDKNKHMCPHCVKKALEKARQDAGVIETNNIKEQ